MYVLGIETSCDETAVSVVKDGKDIKSSKIASSLNLHKKYGGIVPEIAFRMQLETIAQVSESALEQAGMRLKDIDLISVTAGPGLSGSLLPGVSFARAAGFSLNIPVVEANHLHGHIYANFLNGNGLNLPCVGLVVSGGHTSLFYVKSFHKMELLGSTLDDACGEAFDKVAKILGLGYPGGPIIERLSRKGNPGKIKFSCSRTRNPLDFSFSGVKTAVLYAAKARCLRPKEKSDIAASFQETVINALIHKSFLACKLKKMGRLVVGGGVAANNRLRERFIREAKRENIKVYFPPLELCLDNAAMIAGLGYRLFMV